MDPEAQQVVVHPLENGTRRVTIGGTPVGRAYSLDDVVEFLRRAGLDDVEIEDHPLIDWRGGGPEVQGRPE